MFVARVPVKDYDNYIIYEDGRCWSNFSNRFLKGDINKKGYYEYRLYENKIGKKFSFHKLVAEHFLSPKPTEKHTIDHIDRNKKNNHISNLRWATHSEQQINKEQRKSKLDNKNIIITNSKKFKASIKRNKIYYHIGVYDTIEEAIIQRDNFIQNFNEG